MVKKGDKINPKSIANSLVPKKKKMSAVEREELLIENFVGLQHAMTNLSIKFEKLSDSMIKLLQVFEESAKSYLGGNKSNDEDLIKKINSLLDQNKTIARGLVVMEEKVRHRVEPPQQNNFNDVPRNRPPLNI